MNRKLFIELTDYQTHEKLYIRSDSINVLHPNGVCTGIQISNETNVIFVKEPVDEILKFLHNDIIIMEIKHDANKI